MVKQGGVLTTASPGEGTAQGIFDARFVLGEAAGRTLCLFIFARLFPRP